ncbi:MAG: hypothetical protein Q9181_000819 [Wetmoreana brouardii]
MFETLPCSCALKWLDPASIFQETCQACDIRKCSTEPDLSSVLSSIDSSIEPDMSWIPNFRPKKRKSLGNPSPRPSKSVKIDLPKTEQPRTSSPQRRGDQEIFLPAIDEVPEYDNYPQTPGTKRKRRGLQPSEYVILDSPAPAPFQWTPQPQPMDDVIDLAVNQYERPDDPERDGFCNLNGDPPTPMQRKRWKFARWERRLNGGCNCCGQRGRAIREETFEEFLENEVEDETYEEFAEVEWRMRKKPKYAF